MWLVGCDAALLRPAFATAAGTRYSLERVMSESTEGLAPFLAIALVASVVWHVFVKSYGVAVLGATVTTVTTFQAVVYMQLGYLDPFFLFALAASAALAFGIAAVAGLPFRSWRRAHAPSRDAL